MISFVEILRKYRFYLAVILVLPFPLALLISNFKFSILPDDPFPQFKVILHAPGVQAEELEKRVTESAEKVFNGLPSLISMSSKTVDHEVMIELIFDKILKKDDSYLFLQERIDRLKLELPNQVEKISVQEKNKIKLSDLQFVFSKPISPEDIENKLQIYKNGIQQRFPDFNSIYQVKIIPNIEKLLLNQVSLSQFISAIKANGIVVELGVNKGILFQIGRPFKNLNEIESIIIGNRNQRPIRMSDVANIKFDSQESIKKLEVWLDQNKVKNSEVIRRLQQLDPSLTVSQPLYNKKINTLFLVLIKIVCLFILQLIFCRFFFQNISYFIPISLLTFFLIIHFLFWNFLIYEHIDLFQLNSLLLSIILVSTFYFIFLSRLQMFFCGLQLEIRNHKNIEQASILVLAELIPTFFVLICFLYLLNLGTLHTNINFPSLLILKDFFQVGAPLSLLFLLLTPILLDTRFFQKQSFFSKKMNLDWLIPPKIISFTSLFIILVFIFLPLALWKFPLKLANSSSSDDLNSIRKYGSRLTYIWKSDISNNSSKFSNYGEYLLKNIKSEYSVQTFSQTGLSVLNGLKIYEFKQSLKELFSKDPLGLLDLPSSSKATVEVDSTEILSEKIPFFLIAHNDIKDKKSNPVILSNLVKNEKKLMESEIYRSRLLKGHIVHWNKKSKNDNLKLKMPELYLPTPLTQYFFQQIYEFEVMHISILIFSYLLFSLYFNSFFRSAVLVILMSAPLSLVMGLRSIFSWSFHIDSLYLLSWIAWSGAAILLPLTRTIDIFRLRGIDRDIAVHEVKQHQSPLLFAAILFAPLVFILFYFLDNILLNLSIGLWQEGLFVGLSLILFNWISIRWLFPIYYLHGEEYIESLAIKTAQFLKKN